MDSDYLILKNVTKSYDGHSNAVDNVSIDIRRGEFITLLGPSGSGKTTTLMMVAGFEEPSSGSIKLQGRDLTYLKPYRRNIGIVFQNYALFPHMTVFKNIAFPLRMRHLGRATIAKRVTEVLDLVGLSDFSHKYPRELSGGQQQRVALARGLIFNPDVLLLDEPLGALDKNLREQMQVEIKRIHNELGTTMIYVTHDQSEAMTMSDRIAVFKAGKLQQIGAPLDIYDQPTSRFVGEFIGDSNILAGETDPIDPDSVHLHGIGPVKVTRKEGDVWAPRLAVDLLIRPERIRILEHTLSPNSFNRIELLVDTVVNYGDSVLAVGSAGTQRLRIRVAGRAPQIATGTKIFVGWLPGDAHAISRGVG
jgi:putative spermidine/putrescine transport system ATP-binding protein